MMEKLDYKVIWIFFVHGIFSIFSFLVSLSIVILLIFFPRLAGDIDSFFLYLTKASIISVVIAVIFAYIWAKLSYRFWFYEFGENAIKIEKGVIWKKYISIPYERIQNVDIYRGVIARVLGLSDLQVQTAGYSVAYYNRTGAEGRLPGLDMKIAEKLREELISRIKGTKQGL